MKRILVTGATGFLGSHLCPDLSNRGDKVFALWRTMKDRPLLSSEMSYTIGDAKDQKLVERMLFEYEIDCIVHLAAQTQVSVGISNPASVIEDNISGTLAVLEAARLHKTKRIIIASTDKVYGESKGEYVEDMPLMERTPYGVSKACVDMISETYQKTYKMSIAVTRCGNLYGPGHLNWSTLIPGTIKRILNGERPRLRFMGQAKRDFLYIDDAVHAYRKLIDSIEIGAFNFSGGQPEMIRETVSRINGQLGKPADYFDLVDERFGEIQFQALNCVKARTHLQWAPDFDMGQGISRTVAWYRKYLS